MMKGAKTIGVEMNSMVGQKVVMVGTKSVSAQRSAGIKVRKYKSQSLNLNRRES